MKRIIIASILVLSSVSLMSQAVQNYREQNQADQNTKITATLKSSSRLFGEKDDLTTVIMIIPSGSTVEVLDTDSTYHHVVYEENEGYIFKRHATVNRSSGETNYKGRNTVPAREVQEYRQEQSQPVSRFSNLENKYGSNTAARLMEGKIWRGMTAEMVKDSWGTPQKINRVINGNSIKEEWTYRNTWLYIENNTLLEWGSVQTGRRQ